MRARSKATRLTSPHLAEILNGLIIACHDVARALMSASKIVEGDDRRGDLDIGAGRSLGRAAELGGLVRALGVAPARGGSMVESIRAALHGISASIHGEKPDYAHALCKRLELKAKTLYEAASRVALPPETKNVILRHLAEVAAGART